MRGRRAWRVGPIPDRKSTRLNSSHRGLHSFPTRRSSDLRTPGYRSSRRTLQKLAHSYLLYECEDAEHGAWDRFRVRNLGLACAGMPADDSPLRRIAERWSAEERAAVEAIVRAKSSPDEARYLRLMQRHPRLRAAVIELGGDG